MRFLTPYRLSIALRVQLLAVTIFFIGFLTLVNLMRISNERAYPELAHLGIPVYIGVILGFVPVFIGIARVASFAALYGRGQAATHEGADTMRDVKRCAVWVSAWFTAGMPAWWIASQGMDPPLIMAWIFVQLPTSFVFIASALLEQLLRSRIDTAE